MIPNAYNRKAFPETLIKSFIEETFNEHSIVDFER
jgi:hypothetical protein